MSGGRQDFMGHYKVISSKLKKRFLRKPNVSEASARFGELAKQLQKDECPNYSAFCYLAASKCENTLGNSSEECQALVKAAHLFLEAEELNHELLCPGFSENLNAALSTYNSAIKLYLEQNQLSVASSLCLEAGRALEHLDRVAEAIPYYKKASGLQSRVPLDYINTLQSIANCKIKTGDYDGALQTLTEVCDIAEEKALVNGRHKPGTFADILARAEIMKVLLLVYLCPTPQKLVPSNAKTLEKYTTSSLDLECPVSYINEDLFILMQSFVMAHQAQENDVCVELQKDLWPHLTADQNDMLQKIIDKLDD